MMLQMTIEESVEEGVNPSTQLRDQERVSKSVAKLILFHLAESFYQQAVDYDTELPEGCITEQYSRANARVLATVFCHFTNMVVTNNQFLQTFSLKRGLKDFGAKGEDAAFKEMKQLHDRIVLEPIQLTHMNAVKRNRFMESLIFLVEKSDVCQW
jgi:hypothetical protein